MSSYTFEQLCNIENVADRLNMSMRTFASGKDRAAIEQMLSIIRQLRHAATFTDSINIEQLLEKRV